MLLKARLTFRMSERCIVVTGSDMVEISESGASLNQLSGFYIPDRITDIC